jgi:hypothetical protein
VTSSRTLRVHDLAPSAFIGVWTHWVYIMSLLLRLSLALSTAYCIWHRTVWRASRVANVEHVRGGGLCILNGYVLVFVSKGWGKSPNSFDCAAHILTSGTQYAALWCDAETSMTIAYPCHNPIFVLKYANKTHSVSVTHKTSYVHKKGKAVPLQVWSGPEGSRKLR